MRSDDFAVRDKSNGLQYIADVLIADKAFASCLQL